LEKGELMTEQTWLTGTNPAEMYAFVRDRVTERQMNFFLEAAISPAYRGDFEPQSVVESWPLSVRRELIQGPFMARGHMNLHSLEVRADLLREIIGNPFRPIVRREGEFWRSNAAIPQWLWEEKPPNSIEFDPAWLTWNNSTIPNLIRAMMEEECDECQIIHGEHSRYVNAGPDSHWEKCSCGNGYVSRAEPQWDMMLILGDALEEAGCTEAAILYHLRGNELCPHCDGEGVRFYDEDDRLQCKQRCDDCNGTGKRPVRHVVGCWCVELLMGGMQ
jgi:hypothetical protein